MKTEYDYLDGSNDSDVAYVIENIEINEYEYNLFGEIIPLTQFTGNHKLSGEIALRIDKKERILQLI